MVKSLPSARRSTKAAKAADLKGKPNEAKSMAVLMFATIAKRGAEEGMGSFNQVLKKLNSRFDPKKAAQLLGLGKKIKDVNPATAGQKDGVVAWNGQHAVYLDEGKADSYGQASRPMHRHAGRKTDPGLHLRIRFRHISGPPSIKESGPRMTPLNRGRATGPDCSDEDLSMFYAFSAPPQFLSPSPTQAGAGRQCP